MSRSVRVPADEIDLQGDLAVPDGAPGVVLFAHGSGSGRHSPRNGWVAAMLNNRGLATLLIDLLSEREEQVDLVTRELRFDVELLGRRLTAAADWLAADGETEALPIGLFGASTGAAAALITAAERPEHVRAVVSRGGRPDLAAPVLDRVRAPTLLIVGELDHVVIELNEQALALVRAPAQLEIVPGATHLFNQSGALEHVAQLAQTWYARHLRRSDRG